MPPQRLLYTDVIHSIMVFLSLEDLPVAVRLNRQWKEASSSLRVRVRVKPAARETHGMDYALELTKEKWKVIKRHPTAPLLRQVQSLDLQQFCPCRSSFLSDFFPGLRSVCVTDRRFLQTAEEQAQSRLLRTRAVVDAIERSKNLTHVDLNSNAVDDVGISRIAEAIKHGKSGHRLQTLNLSNNRIRDAGFRSIAEVIKTSSSLTSINLSFNLELRATGAVAALADAIGRSESLTSFDISGNNLDAVCMSILAEGIACSKGLQKLYLSLNSINAVDAKAIAEAVKANKSLTFLDISNNEIGNEGVSCIAEAILQSRSLTHLDLSTNRFGAQGAQALAQAICLHESLISLNVRSNHIGESGTLAIVEATKSNPRLTSLIL